jgi:hypothetical protein
MAEEVFFYLLQYTISMKHKMHMKHISVTGARSSKKKKRRVHRERESEEWEVCVSERERERSYLSETLIQTDPEATSHLLQLPLRETKIKWADWMR